MTLLLCIIFVFGLLFGSLSTVLIDRWHAKKWGILLWRSECPHCLHTLGILELIPLVSYIIQRGKCRHCKTRISLLYPFCEIFMGSIFVFISYIAFRENILPFSIEHILFLFLGFITWVYVIYDLLYMEIPDQILVPGIYWYLLLLCLSIFFWTIGNIFFDRFTYPGGILEFVYDHLFAAWILYTFFYIQIFVPWSYYLLSRKRFRDTGDLLLSYIVFPISLIGTSVSGLFRKTKHEKIDEEIPTWVGGGDLRIALFIGITLGTIHGIASFAFAYIIGSIIGIGYLIAGWLWYTVKKQVPFGPFLGLGWFLSLLFHWQVLEITQFYFNR